MDTFFEQIVSIKKSGKTIALFLSVWVFAILLCLFLLLSGLVGPLTPILVVGIGYGAWWLTAKLNIEYEYIITNGTMDVDKIINKSSRQRIPALKFQRLSALKNITPTFYKTLKRKIWFSPAIRMTQMLI